MEKRLRKSIPVCRQAKHHAETVHCNCDVRANHSRLIRENGAKSIVLLKNTKGALRLKKPLMMSIFGANAGPAMAGLIQVSTQSKAPAQRTMDTWQLAQDLVKALSRCL